MFAPCLPQIRVRMDRSTGLWRDSTGKVVAIAELNEGVHVLGPRRRRSVDHDRGPRRAGYAKHARRAREQLREARLSRRVNSTRWRAARCERGVDLAGFSATATVPLDPRMASIDGFRAVFANLAVDDLGQLARRHRPDRHEVPARPAHRGPTDPHGARRIQGRAPRRDARSRRRRGSRGSQVRPERRATSTCICSSGTATPIRSAPRRRRP